MAFTGQRVKRSVTEGDVLSGITQVSTIEWVGATTAGHQCVLTDENGDNVWESVADGQYFKDVHAHFDWVRDLTVTTLDSGTLYVYIL